MTDEAKITMVKALSDEESDEVISAFLAFAGEDLCAIFIPGSGEDEKTSFLDKYATAQVKAAAYYLNKRGWDFQTSHSENGVGRVYETGDLPDSILRLITPKAVTVT